MVEIFDWLGASSVEGEFVEFLRVRPIEHHSPLGFDYFDLVVVSGLVVLHFDRAAAHVQEHHEAEPLEGGGHWIFNVDY